MQSPKKFIFITTHITTDLGGSEYLWLETAQSLLIHGHRVEAIIPSHYPHQAEIKHLADEGAVIRHYPLPPWHRLPRALGTFFEKKLRKPLAYHATAREILKSHRKSPATLVVHNRTTHLNGIPITTALRRHAIPYINIVHAAAEWHWPEIGEISSLKESYTHALQNYFVSQAAQITTENHIGTLLPQSHIVANPIRIDQHNPMDWPTASTLRLACVARINPISKGHDLALRLLAASPWRERDIHLTFFGEGPYRATLENLAAALGISSKVTFHGHEHDLKKIWSTHHALFLPSRHEGMPLAILEAMAAARPCITTDVGGHREWITHGLNGFIAAAPTLHSLNLTLEEVWQQRHALETIGSEARKIILARYRDKAGAGLSDHILRRLT
jgi:glycosyltransferase involved in cell wall biosynthesis